MSICPVCRSQNMESAKFCGNCGNPFPKSTDPTSSLINCPQGHIFSAVYDQCPYCPQSDVSAQGPFETYVENPVTAVDPQSARTAINQSPRSEFATRVEQSETLFDTTEAPSFQQARPAPVEPVMAPTEVIAPIPGLESVLESALGGEPPTRFEQASPAEAEIRPEAAPLPPASPVLVVENEKDVEEPPTPAITGSDLDRRTIVVSDQSPNLSSKGKIVGWLISYTNNQDGVDHRIYAGYNRMGANPVCDIVIDDETVSGSHAILVHRDGRCLIKDDLSRNGTYVNGREITEAHTLQSYDQIRVGNTILTYVSAQRDF